MMRLFRSKRMLASTVLGASLVMVPGCNLDVAMHTIGRLQIHVEDTAGNPVPNIRADLLLDDKITVWRTTTTGADGRAEFDAAAGGVVIQGYYVRLILTPDWNLAPGEPNDKAVVPRGGSVLLVQFRIAKVTPVP